MDFGFCSCDKLKVYTIYQQARANYLAYDAKEVSENVASNPYSSPKDGEQKLLIPRPPLYLRKQ